MMRSLWIAKTGMDVQQNNMDAISNNLANVNTNGFKSTRPIFQDLLYQTYRSPGGQSSQQTQLPTGLQLGTGAQTVATERIFTQGTLQQSGNQLDVAINGNGFLQVQMPDGTTAYTRDGSLTQNAQGQLVTPTGYLLIPQITLPTGTTQVTIAPDGTVSALAGNSTAPTQIGQIQLANFINPAGLSSQGQNLYLESQASGNPTTSTPGLNGLGTLQQGFVENSNVNVTEELVNMIQAQRAFEMNSKSISAADQMLQTLTQLA